MQNKCYSFIPLIIENERGQIIRFVKTLQFSISYSKYSIMRADYSHFTNICPYKQQILHLKEVLCIYWGQEIGSSKDKS